MKLDICKAITMSQMKHELFWMDRGLSQFDIKLLNELEANEVPTEDMYESRHSKVKCGRMIVEEVLLDIVKYRTERMDA